MVTGRGFSNPHSVKRRKGTDARSSTCWPMMSNGRSSGRPNGRKPSVGKAASSPICSVLWRNSSTARTPWRRHAYRGRELGRGRGPKSQRDEARPGLSQPILLDIRNAGREGRSHLNTATRPLWIGCWFAPANDAAVRLFRPARRLRPNARWSCRALQASRIWRVRPGPPPARPLHPRSGPEARRSSS